MTLFRNTELTLVLAISITLFMPCQMARILCVSHQFGSHMKMVHDVAEGLIERGHEVYTIFSDRMPIPKGLEDKGFKVLRYNTPRGSDIMATGANRDTVLHLTSSEIEAKHWAYISGVAGRECIDMDNDVELYRHLTNLRFDLAIIDTFVLAYCLTFMPLKLNIPFVLVPQSMEIEAVRTPLLPSFFPSLFSRFTEEMTFTERLQNTYVALFMNFPMINRFPGRMDSTLIEKYKGDQELTTWFDVSRKAELFLMSRGFVVEYPAPLTPNVISVECLTCKPGKKLPTNFEVMTENAEAIIVVSFGSLIDNLPDDIARKFMDAFSERKELIFWRFGGKFPGAIPDNVKLMDWLPQNDLLAHPKTKLFITHSGNNGQYESAYHGVPILAVPVFAEQPHNAVRIVKHGFGLKLDIYDFSVKELADKMAEIIDNPVYRQNINKASRILKSMPMDAKQITSYWIEHVLEFGGDHLKSHALNMPWYSYYMFDILIFVEAVIILLFCACVYVSLLVYRAIFAPAEKLKKN